MKEHSVNQLNNFMAGWYLENTSLCDQIIDYHKNNEYKTEGIQRVRGIDSVDKTRKDSIDCTLKDPLLGKYYSELQKVVDVYVKKYPYCNSYDSWGTFEQINVQYYAPHGGYHNWHTERSSGEGMTGKRHLVFMTYLNDVTDDGETEFYHQQIKIKPEKGLTIIWPADWTFTHRGITSKTQEKYIVTGWFNFVGDASL